MITKSPAFNILSKKDKAIFEGLLELKHLDEESIDAILKAGELTGDTSRLSAFAISYLFLEKNNVPVRDTIVMANELGQKIYLWASARAWQEKHDRFKKLANLKGLKDTNKAFDCAVYEEKLLPFKGYVIKSSKRLASIGLSEKHCLGSYSGQVERGQCAIASVFVEKTRWCVELRLQNGEVVAHQIKGKRNKNPDERTKSAILADLGVREFRYRENDVKQSGLEMLREVWDEVVASGHKTISIEWYGGGDSGNIETIEGDADSGINDFLHGKLMDIGDQLIEEPGINIWDNDGGQGDIVIDVEAQSVKVTLAQNVSVVEDIYESTRQIMTGQDL